MPEYAIKNVKTFRGRDGHGFNASLYKGNKRVATVDDPARGSDYDWHWLDYKKPRVKITVKSHKGDNSERSVTPEEKIFVEHVRITTDELLEPEDCFVGALVDEYETRKYWKSKCRGKTIFTLKEDSENSYRTLNMEYGQKAKLWLKDKYGVKVKEIINERFVEKVSA
jgi:hypothetical protein